MNLVSNPAKLPNWIAVQPEKMCFLKLMPIEISDVTGVDSHLVEESILTREKIGANDN